MRRQAFVLSLILTLIFNLILTIVFFHWEQARNEQTKEDYLAHEKLIVDAAVKNINTQIISNLADLAFIKDTYLRSLNTDDGENDLLSDWVLFSKNKGIYHKIRFIDLRGQEIVRVDKDEETSFVSTHLEDRSSRPFFYEGIQLEEDEYYVSRFDLNLENGVVHFPIIPTIRVVQTVYDNRILKGIVVLNYDAHILIDTFISDMVISQADHFYLLNEKGDYILNTANRNFDWDFMFNSSISFKSQYPDVFKVVENNNSGYVSDNDKIYYFSHVLHFDYLTIETQYIEKSQINNHEEWYVITEVNESEIPYHSWDNFLSFLFDFKRSSLIYSFILFNGIGFILYFYFLNRINTEMLMKYDPMSGAYSRIHGLKIAEERFNMMLANNHTVTVVFGDLNGLKEINDRLGHQAGDLAIMKFSQAIINNIRFVQRTYFYEFILHRLSSKVRKYFNFREDDIFVRLGGDEFLYMCFDVNREELEKIEERVLADVAQEDIEGLKLSASTGALVVSKEMDIDFETALNLADHTMYDDKMRYYKKVNKEFL